MPLILPLFLAWAAVATYHVGKRLGERDLQKRTQDFSWVWFQHPGTPIASTTLVRRLRDLANGYVYVQAGNGSKFNVPENELHPASAMYEDVDGIMSLIDSPVDEIKKRIDRIIL